jgi:hypothetical protein
MLYMGNEQMDEKEYRKKYTNLRILKSVQDYLKGERPSAPAVYPIHVPDDFLYQLLKLQGAEETDKLIHHIFKLGLNLWSEEFYSEAFGSEQKLEDFIELVKERNQK